MNKKLIKQLANILFVILLFILMIVIVSNSTKELNIENLKEFFSSSDKKYLIIAFCLSIFYILFEAISLFVILRKLGYKVKLRSAIAYSTSDVYYSAITPSASGGQPASAFYMIRDGVDGGTASFSLVFNLIGYTSAIIIMGIVALFFGFDYFINLETFSLVLIVIGFLVQLALLVFLILCMCKHSWIKKFCMSIINLLVKIKIIKKREKWENKVINIIDKYNACYHYLQKHKNLILPIIIFNLIQRVSQVLITAFVCKSATNCNIFDVFVLQALVLLGYNSIPLPGGSVAYEFLYLSVFGLVFDDVFIAITMMVSRVISYYISLIISGIYTIVYHMAKKKREMEYSNINDGENYGK